MTVDVTYLYGDMNFSTAFCVDDIFLQAEERERFYYLASSSSFGQFAHWPPPALPPMPASCDGLNMQTECPLKLNMEM